MSDGQDSGGTRKTSAEQGPDLLRRRLLQHALWVAPAIVGTAAVKARAQSQSCSPTSQPPNCAPRRR